MVTYDYHLRLPRPVGGLILAATACLSVYLYVRPALAWKPKPRCTARGPSHEGDDARSAPYPRDALPGGRYVPTPYGSIKVLEWGPEAGEKVVLLHGISTPCLGLGDMAEEFVRQGHRVLLFDWFGRGYSEAPLDLPYDDRLYTAQLLLALASSPLPWTGSCAFHLVGYSLGGAVAASFAAYFPHMLRSLTLICPGGLVRSAHLSYRSRLLYSEHLFPESLLRWLTRWRLQPSHGAHTADIPDGEDEAAVDFDAVRLSTRHGATVTVGDLTRWQLDRNQGFLGAYMSTIRNAPIYDQHRGGIWRRLSTLLAERRDSSACVDTTGPQGLSGGRLCLILGRKDSVVVPDEWIEDSKMALGDEGVHIHVMEGGHEIALSRGAEVAAIAMRSWQRT